MILSKKIKLSKYYAMQYNWILNQITWFSSGWYSSLFFNFIKPFTKSWLGEKFSAVRIGWLFHPFRNLSTVAVKTSQQTVWKQKICTSLLGSKIFIDILIHYGDKSIHLTIINILIVALFNFLLKSALKGFQAFFTNVLSHPFNPLKSRWVLRSVFLYAFFFFKGAEGGK